MRSRIVFKVLLIILLILLATPLLGALAMMASGNSMMAQMPSMMDGRMMGLATIWIALILLLIVVAIVSIYAPEIPRSIPMVQIMSKAVVVGRYTVTPVPTVHSHRVRSVGYVVQTGADKVFYSSDMVRIEPKYHHLLRHLDLVITEGSFIRSRGLVRIESGTGEPFGHNGIPDLIEFFSRFSRRIIVTHFGTWFFKNVSKSRQKIESFIDSVRVIPAYDGMVVDLAAIKRGQRSF